MCQKTSQCENLHFAFSMIAKKTHDLVLHSLQRRHAQILNTCRSLKRNLIVLVTAILNQRSTIHTLVWLRFFDSKM